MSENKRFSDIFRIKNLINALVGFIETKVELYKIQFKEEIAKALSIMVIIFLMAMIGLLFLLFLSHFLAQLINDLLESDYLGYLIITILYLLVGMVVYLRRKKISNAMINLMFPEEESDNDTENEQ